MQFLKRNFLVIILLGFIAYMFLQNFFVVDIGNVSVPFSTGGRGSSLSLSNPAMPEMARDSYGIVPPDYPEPAPVDSTNRIVIQDTTLSMVVRDVASAISDIAQIASNEGGFLVNSNLSMPEGAANGMITIRVPVEKRDSVLEQIKRVGVNVVSENIDGRDVTDQYEDIEERLAVLNQTKAKFQEILDQATEVQDLLQVQRKLISLQTQIDNLKGRQEYLTQSAQLTRIIVYLSTDELSLPYTPDNAWRPQAVFKQAVRSLIVTFRFIGNVAIWGVVYSVILVPLAVGAYLINKVIKHRKHVREHSNH